MPVLLKKIGSLKTEQAKAKGAARYIKSRISLLPRIALVLGSGLGDFADQLEVDISIASSEIPDYPESSVQGHAGKLVFGRIATLNRKSWPLLVFKGRVHFYESGDLKKTLFPVLLSHQLGIKTLILTNAAGGINSRFMPGDLMLIRDVISLTFLDVFKESGTKRRKKSRGCLSDPKINAAIIASATSSGTRLQQGTYCWLKGPSYESPAEIRMLRALGADAVGMSTVPEMMLAADLGMRIGGISLISNLAAGISPEKLSHAEVTDTANKVKAKFTQLMRGIILGIDSERPDEDN